MHGNHHANETRPADAAAARGARRRTPWPLMVVAALLVVVPFLAWYGTWFGRALGDDETEQYLKDEEKPRRAQHALSQVAARIESGDAGVRRFYPQVLALGASPVTDLRMTAAWVMGADNRAGEFHEALVKLLEDPEPIVRRNAALALVRFGDARGRAELRAMLRPYAVRAPAAGTALTVLSEGTEVRREAMLARLKLDEAGKTLEVRSPLPGKVGKSLVREGEPVGEGREMFLLAPDEEQIKDALVALYYVGEAEDLTEVGTYAAGVAGLPDYLKRQAALTTEAVRRRSQQR